MIKQQTISVRSAIDVVTARMQVRETARRLGMSLADQSRISLATSSLANALGLGKGNTAEGQVVVECLENGERRGVRVSCLRFDCQGYVPPVSYFGNERWMVDEFNMKVLPSDTLEVTLTKWSAS
jgi:hypothetical protein